MDIALSMIDSRSAGAPIFDISISGGDLAHDDGLTTAVLLSLFCDARLPDSADVPDGGDDRRGYWADYFSAPGTNTGSLLWTLRREKITKSLLVRARTYAMAALQWLIDDGVASTVTVSAERYGVYSVALAVEIVSASGVKWERTWNYQLGFA